MGLCFGRAKVLLARFCYLLLSLILRDMAAKAVDLVRGFIMKVRASVKKICRNCKVIKRKNVLRVICSVEPRHKQRQG